LIAADTSTWVAYLDGVDATDTKLLDRALQGGQLLMPPAVLTELMSNPDLPPAAAQALLEVPPIEVESGFWVRAGQLRAKGLAQAASTGALRC
jgi:hypothetical protein